jgi:hypothetical protein
MPKKTLYVKEQDEPIWERAAKLAQGDEDSLSKLVVEALAEFVTKKEAQRQGEERTGRPMQEYKFENFGTLNRGVRQTIRFVGVLLFEKEHRDFGKTSSDSHQLFLTKSRKLVWIKKELDERDNQKRQDGPTRGATFKVFDEFFGEFEDTEELQEIFGDRFPEIAAVKGEDSVLEIE